MAHWAGVKFSVTEILVRWKNDTDVTSEVGLGREPCLVVMGGDLWSRGRGFDSQHRILAGHFVVKVVMFVWKKAENKLKEAGNGPFFNIRGLLDPSPVLHKNFQHKIKDDCIDPAPLFLFTALLMSSTTANKSTQPEAKHGTVCGAVYFFWVSVIKLHYPILRHYYREVIQNVLNERIII